MLKAGPAGTFIVQDRSRTNRPITVARIECGAVTRLWTQAIKWADLGAKPKPNNTKVRPNVEAWPNRTEPKASAEYSADVRPKPNFGASLKTRMQLQQLLLTACFNNKLIHENTVCDISRKCLDVGNRVLHGSGSSIIPQDPDYIFFKFRGNGSMFGGNPAVAG